MLPFGPIAGPGPSAAPAASPQPNTPAPVAAPAPASGAGLDNPGGQQQGARGQDGGNSGFRSAGGDGQRRGLPEKPQLATAVAARLKQQERLLGFPPLDTRVVGDKDKIDPARPTARIPEPLVTVGELRRGEARPVPVPKPLPPADEPKALQPPLAELATKRAEARERAQEAARLKAEVAARAKSDAEMLRGAAREAPGRPAAETPAQGESGPNATAPARKVASSSAAPSIATQSNPKAAPLPPGSGAPELAAPSTATDTPARSATLDLRR